MIRQLFQDLRVYFNALPNPTDNEQLLNNRLNSGCFPVTSIERIDLEAVGFNTQSVTDEQMMDLSEKMSNDYCGQLFHSSLEIIAEECFGIPRHPFCPKCEKNKVLFDAANQTYRCQACGQEWGNDYVLVQFPEDTSYFNQEEIGYPSSEAEDSQARYIPEYEYILHFQKSPEANQYYRPVRWPESQQYMSDDIDDSIDALNEPTLDEKGLEDFGDDSIWIPLCSLSDNDDCD